MKKLFGILFLTLFLAAGSIFLLNSPTVGKALADNNEVDGACGTTVDTCIKGNFKDKPDDEHHYEWECEGSGGGDDVDCEINKSKKVDCVGSWSDNSTCSVTCGGGVLQQVFNITTPASCGGTECANKNGDTRWGTTSCNTNSCSTECPANSTLNSDEICVCNTGYHQVNTDNSFICEADPTVTPTVTPEPTTPPAGHGDGLSDGGSSCPSCTQAPSSGTQAVLGASTGPAVLGLSTTSGEENYLAIFAQLFGALTSAGLGFKFFKK